MKFATGSKLCKPRSDPRGLDLQVAHLLLLPWFSPVVVGRRPACSRPMQSITVAELSIPDNQCGDRRQIPSSLKRRLRPAPRALSKRFKVRQTDDGLSGSEMDSQLLNQTSSTLYTAKGYVPNGADSPLHLGLHSPAPASIPVRS